VQEELQRLVLQMYRSGLRYSEAVREFQRTFLATVLREEDVNQVRAAERLGMHRNTLRRQIHELELDIKALRVARRRPPSSERVFVGPKRARTSK
jgi:DNA-binding NtrC family response regulator